MATLSLRLDGVRESDLRLSQNQAAHHNKLAGKNVERIGFPDISDSQAVLLRGI